MYGAPLSITLTPEPIMASDCIGSSLVMLAIANERDYQFKFRNQRSDMQSYLGVTKRKNSQSLANIPIL